MSPSQSESPCHGQHCHSLNIRPQEYIMMRTSRSAHLEYIWIPVHTTLL
uniref:Uncharacterized protein n=1 Tax=Anguilla anguilla TaxID=7936 RepID=A0A0E9W8P2_ANGAN